MVKLWEYTLREYPRLGKTMREIHGSPHSLNTLCVESRSETEDIVLLSLEDYGSKVTTRIVASPMCGHLVRLTR